MKLNNDYEFWINKIYVVEQKYKTENIKIGNLQIWPILKPQIFRKGINNKEVDLNARKKLTILKTAFFGFKNLLRKDYKYVLFTDTLEKRLINGVYVDKIAQGILDELGKDNFLIIEKPVHGRHYTINKCQSNQIVSLNFFYVLAEFLYLIKMKKVNLKIEGEDILKNILKDLNVDIDYRYILKVFLSLVKIFENLFKRIRPKYIFITCYYSLSHQAAIYAAKRKKIKTIELQHGIINEKHIAYNFFKDFKDSVLPEHLFVFGDFFKKFFDNGNFFIKNENVYSVGSYYIEKIKQEKLEDNIISKIKKSYKRIIVISSQETIEPILLNFIIKIAQQDKRNFYIFRPRNIHKNLKIKDFENFYLSLGEDEDIYKLLKVADIHATVYSTTCIESLCFGVPNIMININNLSKLHFGKILNNENHTRYVSTVEEFINLVNKWNFNKESIIKFSEYFYKSNHKLNIRNAINQIGG